MSIHELICSLLYNYKNIACVYTNAGIDNKWNWEMRP